MDADDDRVIRITELLEAALALASSADAETRFREISQLCRDAAEVASG